MDIKFIYNTNVIDKHSKIVISNYFDNNGAQINILVTDLASKIS